MFGLFFGFPDITLPLWMDETRRPFPFPLSCVRFSRFFSRSSSVLSSSFTLSFHSTEETERCVYLWWIYASFYKNTLCSCSPKLYYTLTSHHPPTEVEVSGVHFFMPDYPCLFVFREADRDSEIKARKPDKAGLPNIPVFLWILKGVNLLWVSLLAWSWPAWYVTHEIASAKIACTKIGYRRLGFPKMTILNSLY